MNLKKHNQKIQLRNKIQKIMIIFLLFILIVATII